MKTTGTEAEAEEKRLQKNANQRRRYAQLSKTKKDAILEKNRERYAESKRKLAIGKESSLLEKNHTDVRLYDGRQRSEGNNSNVVTNKYTGSKISPTKKNNAQQMHIQDAGVKFTKTFNTNNADKIYTHSTKLDSAHGYANKGIVIKDIATEDLPREQSENTTDRGKAQISLHSSFDIGSKSLCVTEAVHSAKNTSPLPPGVTYPETGNLVSGTYPTHTHDDTCQKMQSIKRKRSILNKGSKKSGQGIFKSVHTDIASSSKRGKKDEIPEDADTDTIDEIQRFQSARWISASEAMWRIYRFTMNDMRLSVQSLQLHLEGYCCCSPWRICS